MIFGQMPSYEERLVQMEAILKNSVTHNVYGEQDSGPRTPAPEVLKELSNSRYTVYDVLPAFFEHEDPMVTLAAFEVYVRRVYRAYSLLSIDYEEGDEESGVDWRHRCAHQQKRDRGQLRVRDAVEVRLGEKRIV